MKKVFTLLLAIILIVCCVALLACDPNNDNVDKASQNAEFVSFRKKIVTILKDNGIFVNDLDNKEAGIAAGSGMLSAADLLYSDGDASDKIADIGAIMTKNEYLEEDSEGYDFALKQVYEIALKMSLCIGDGMLNYFDEKEFYNIPVYFPDMNIVITEDDNRSCVYCYQKTQDNVEYIQKIEVVFNGDKDYYFTVTEPTGDWMISSDYENSVYFYGDSSKRFLMFRSGIEATYSPNGTDFYLTSDLKALSDCLDVLGGETFEYDVTEYRKIKDNVKHTFNEEQVTALMDKYFKDVQSDIEHRPSEFIYNSINGKNVLIGYYASEGETEVVIPSDVKYISEEFIVNDIDEKVTSLTIPSSVIEIVDSEGKPETDWQYVRFILGRQNGETLFQNITVAQGSPLFKPGSGHLTLQDGTVVYALDKACVNFDLNVLICASKQTREGCNYKNVYKILSDTLNLDYDETICAMQKYDTTYENIAELVQKVCENSYITQFNFAVSTSNVTVPDGDTNSGRFANLNFEIDLKSDVTINVLYKDMQPQDEASLAIALTNGSDIVRNVAVNVTGFTYRTVLDVGPKQPEPDKGGDNNYVSDCKIFTSFNLDVMQMYYDSLCYGKLIRDKQNSQVNFDSSQDEKFRYFEIHEANTNPSYSNLYCDINITNDVRSGDIITVPSELFGLPVRKARIDVSAIADKNVTVILPDLEADFDCVEFYNSDDLQPVSLDNEEFIISCANGLELLKQRITNYDLYTEYSISFTIQSDDDTDIFQTGWIYAEGNPDNVKYHAYLTVDGEEKEIWYSKRDGVVLSDVCEAGVAYFVIPRDYLWGASDITLQPLNVYKDDQGKLRCEFEEICENANYALVKQPLGEREMRAVITEIDKEFSLSVVFTEEERDGKTYFEGKIPLFEITYEQVEPTTVEYDIKSVTNVSFNGWFDLSYIMRVTEFVYDAADYGEESYQTFSDAGNVELRVICVGDELRVEKRNSYVDREITVCIEDRVIRQTIRLFDGANQVKFNVDEWNIDDVDNQVFYIKYAASEYGHPSQARMEIAFIRENGSTYAISQWPPSRRFTLEKYSLGESRKKITGSNYELTIYMNVVRPDFITASDGVIVDFNKSSYSIEGTVEGRPVSGTANVPYGYYIYYLDVEGYICKYFWVFDAQGEPDFRLLDEYITMQVIVGDKTYEKRIALGQTNTIDMDWLDLQDGYAYFWRTSYGMISDVIVTDGKVNLYIPKGDDGNSEFDSITLMRMAYDVPNTFHIQDDDGQGNSYNLDITITVTLDDSIDATPYNKVSVTASGRYNEGEIKGAAENSSIYSVSFTWKDNDMSTTPRKFILELDGLDIKIVGLGEKLF